MARAMQAQNASLTAHLAVSFLSHLQQTGYRAIYRLKFLLKRNH